MRKPTERKIRRLLKQGRSLPRHRKTIFDKLFGKLTAEDKKRRERTRKTMLLEIKYLNLCRRLNGKYFRQRKGIRRLK